MKQQDDEVEGGSEFDAPAHSTGLLRDQFISRSEGAARGRFVKALDFVIEQWWANILTKPACGATVYAVFAALWLVSMGRMRISHEATAAAGASNLVYLYPYWIASAGMWVGLSVIGLHLLEQNRGRREKRRLQRLVRVFAPSVAGSRSSSSDGGGGAAGAGAMTKTGSTFRAKSKYLGIPGMQATDNVTRNMTIILVVAALLQVLTIAVYSSGNLSQDIWRYVYDGRTILSGHNPYLATPSATDPVHQRFVDESFLAQMVNDPKEITAFLPGSQCVFATLSFFSAAFTNGSVGMEAIFDRIVFSALNLVVVWILMTLLLDHERRDVWWAALYAWHPLVLTEVAGSGHCDVVGILFMVLALYVVYSRTLPLWRWTPLLALAGAMRPIVLAIGAFPLRRTKKDGQRRQQQQQTSSDSTNSSSSVEQELQWKIWLYGLVGLTLTLAVVYSLFLFASGPKQFVSVLVAIAQSATKRVFGGSVCEPLLACGIPIWWVWLIGLILSLAAGFYLFKHEDHRLRASCKFLLAVFLFSTAAFPWTLLWALVLLPVAPNLGLWIASLTVPWAYASLGDTVHGTIPVWVMGIIYVPIYIALVCDFFGDKRHNTTRSQKDRVVIASSTNE